MKKIIYLRTSTEEQNPQNQLDECKKLVGEEEIDIREEQQSAFKDKNREVFESIKKEIKNKLVLELICWDLDRLYRNRRKLIEFFEFCKIYGCKISSVRQQWLNELNKMPEPFNEIMHGLMLQIMGWLAEEESKKRSERVKLAMKKKNGKIYSKQGNKWGRKPIHTNKIKVIRDLRSKGLTYKEISEKAKISVGKISEILISEKQKDISGENPPRISYS